MLQRPKSAWIKFAFITIILCYCALEKQQLLPKQPNKLDNHKITLTETQASCKTKIINDKCLQQEFPKRVSNLGVR
ncbi:hypothetical protein [Nostoc sp. FACHB-190]|uniref:hypothetical protein n=1 Tax=Nostoc sp. FACHB-190 TaxID=2692838 RepID=UPI001685CBB6|nr:hypothetical protein [Nostoc sp. FACHB-190]MBD2302313.1 hypothetical protein [Nostoc sp. FACHB-190]